MKRTVGQPLAGISVLVTRAEEQSKKLMDDLTSLGADVTVIPAVLIVPIEKPTGFSEVMGRVGLYDKVVFTSVNGVRITSRLLRGEATAPRDLPPALCVGEKTADEWGKAGGRVAAVPESYTAEALLDSLSSELGGNNFLIIRPETVKTELGQALKQRGADVDEVIVYRTVTPDEGADALHELMATGKPDVVFFASPSAVEGTLALAAQDPKPKAQRSEDNSLKGPITEDLKLKTQNAKRIISDIPAICIGPTTAKAAEEAGFTEIYFPDEHTAEGMVEELLVISGKLK